MVKKDKLTIIKIKTFELKSKTKPGSMYIKYRRQGYEEEDAYQMVIKFHPNWTREQQKQTEHWMREH
jgi:hypothetical protein